jgi:hypothetical protein
MVLALGCGTDFQGTNGPDSFTPDPPSVYVAKVKNVLVGQAPTDAEITAVKNDPNALGGLIDGWMQTPEYEAKMLVFFELAFQQTQISTADFIDLLPNRGLSRGPGAEPLLQNIRESFARTVLELIKQGRPLTDAFTTEQVMMTPPLMALYAYMDTRQVHDDATIADKFASANPTLNITVQYSTARTPLSHTLTPGDSNYMVWNSPDLPNVGPSACNTTGSFTFGADSQQLFGLLFGAIPGHSSGGQNCPAQGASFGSVQFDPSDFTAWKMVTIRRPATGETPTLFYDILGMRTANQLVVKTPHPGFFSTPAFFANWPTNQSNQMRVTANQALIVALGAQFDGADDTSVPSPPPGLDSNHAQPGTMCYSCHQLLDPTRSIFSATYSWFYSQQDQATLRAVPGLFAFQGVVQPMATIQDFGKMLTTHPLVGKAWAQKLCYYVNSAPCDPSDPEFQRIVADFSNGFGWNTLVHELLSSPITTNAKDTVTRQTNGEVIAVSRRDHLCAALNSRLGFVDICQLDASTAPKRPSLIAQIVSGLPSDGYGRGSVVPDLPNQPSLFYRAGLETICTNVAQMVIDGPADPTQPGAIKWSSAQPDAAVADFVSLVMALTSSDPRSGPASSVLLDHYHQAIGQGATPTTALRSTFIVACLSPSFVGIGM